jgi:hypothetical protein
MDLDVKKKTGGSQPFKNLGSHSPHFYDSGGYRFINADRLGYLNFMVV